MRDYERIKGPLHVIRYNHAEGDTWLALGFTDAEGRKIGPLTEFVGGAVTDTPPCWHPMARMKYITGADEQLVANAVRLAAGWNLLDELERMGALDLLMTVRRSIETSGFDTSSQRLARVEDAIRTALESKS